ncbi:hypothetical protein Tco_0322965, partial [Tanacetum coccineum]
MYPLYHLLLPLFNSSSKTSLDSHSDTSPDSSLRHSSSGHPILDSPCDSSTATFARPSRKRCRSPTSSVHVASPVPGALSPVHADLLPPHKRIRDFDTVTDFEFSLEEVYVPYVPREIGLGVDVEDNYKPYTEPDVYFNIQADIDACIAFANDIAARRTNVRVEDGTAAKEEAESSATHTTEIGDDRVTHLVVTDDIDEPVREDFPNLVSDGGSLEVMQRGLDVVKQELYDHMVEISVHRVRVIESRDNVRLRGMLDVERQRVDRLRRSMSMTQDAINELIAKRVEEALKAYEAARNPKTKTKMENEQQDENVEANVNNGNGNGNGN